jgi:hypothetical protein
MKLHLKKNIKDDSLVGMFYIIDCSRKDNPDFWQLRTRKEHFVLSATGGKDKILECLTNIVKKYKYKHVINRLVTQQINDYNHLSGGTKNVDLTPAERLSLREKHQKELDAEYETKGKQYNQEINNIIRNIEGNRTNNVKHRKPHIIGLKKHTTNNTGTINVELNLPASKINILKKKPIKHNTFKKLKLKH